ncbi:hypothetical protein [Paenibacillus oceani]|uniref:Cobalamin biosynthesis protein CbiN n=1 Tax=Paenibacillus oceani TaxID=2772510 RepID=A0A927CA35_9BACL|nr:hypothetical protein [Paenibacillus oceani]MBD2862120.1 hypothetical protein [Paenibacillus oceani]
MKKLILAVWIAMFGMWSAVPEAQALSCAPPRPVNEEMDTSSVVFKGTVIEIRQGGLTVFQVDRAWKGVDGPRVQIYDNGWDPYTKGADYLVFGGQREGQLRTNLCGRTGPWDPARDEAMKGAGIQPAVFQTEQAPVSGTPAEQAGRYTGVLVWTGILLVAISGIVLYRNKKKTT